MTSILLCHFPVGTCFGIIAPIVEPMLRVGRQTGLSASDVQSGYRLKSAATEPRLQNSMSTINGLSPGGGVSAESRFRIMPKGHGGCAYYNQARYMPGDGAAGMAWGLGARPTAP
jgi:hypothetical protein